MTTYLTIITTALVLTQIIRLIQNSIQLKHLVEHKQNEKESEDLLQNINKNLEYILNKMYESDEKYDIDKMKEILEFNGIYEEE